MQLPSDGSNALLQLAVLKRYQGTLLHKDTIAAFVRGIVPTAGNDQQIRHLGSQAGWNVLNARDKIPNEEAVVPIGYHVLLSSESPKVSFFYKALKRLGRLAARDFTQLKAAYDFRCASCGSVEGKPHLAEPSVRTQLQQGHKNPRRPLSLDNTVPQCQLCNQVYQDDFVFDDKGRVVAVASVRPVQKADPDVQQEIRQALA